MPTLSSVRPLTRVRLLVTWVRVFLKTRGRPVSPPSVPNPVMTICGSLTFGFSSRLSVATCARSSFTMVDPISDCHEPLRPLLEFSRV